MAIIHQLFTTAVLSYVCTTLGILYTLPSSTLKLFSSENTTLNRIMTETEISLMGSVSSASTLLLTPFCGYLLDTLGRKRAIILFYFPQVEAVKSIAFYKGAKPNSNEVITQIENIRKLLNADIDLEEEKLQPDENKAREKLPIVKYLAKSRSTRRAMCAVLVLYTLTVFQGLIVVQIFAAPLFEAAVLSMSATLSSVLFAIITVGAGLLGAFLIDTVGRRLLLITTSFATGLLCVMLGVTIHFNLGPSWLSGVFIYLYAITYTVGPGAVPNVLLGEVFLPDIKGFATMVCVEWSFLCTFIILYIFNPVFETYGLGPLFFFFSCFSFFTALFTFFYLPETKGLPADVIQRKFLQRKKF